MNNTESDRNEQGSGYVNTGLEYGLKASAAENGNHYFRLINCSSRDINRNCNWPYLDYCSCSFTYRLFMLQFV